ncbi:phosphoribosylformylglycinamidine synthase I [Thermaerobacter subterraneus]|uniref:Phosphoribosylformylglycinamidine synthase subunit PurQ n=1 Tax=Thermaerobacter subterraneus DSM 13965 TaxID=867903 RepID=K6P3Q6_9FIRM|nr:phosphoribosylformylglycinamidine synthase I [Thermaerobacter subterraneus]EKP95685.1 phosphoribosylformylglycinamidine synthase I [Thermaerobacter subterraneus DSM 13965]
MRLAVVRFPGSNCEHDVAVVLARELGRRVEVIDHRRRDLRPFAGVVLPGGFAFGDYLRAGALAARTPVMEAVRDFAAAGGPVLGICNGFQILCEAGLLPGALRPNRQGLFQCRPIRVRVEGPSALTAGLPPGRVVRLEIAHGEGAYVGEGPQGAFVPGRGARVILRYSDAAGRIDPDANPNGSVDNVAGICNAAGNVVGLMPHPERRPAEGPGTGWAGGDGGRAAPGGRAGGGPRSGAPSPVPGGQAGTGTGAGAAGGAAPTGPTGIPDCHCWDGLDLLARWVAAAAAWWSQRRAGPRSGPSHAALTGRAGG